MEGRSPPVRFALNELLNIVPELTSLEPYRDLNLNNWRKGGVYRLLSSTKQGFDLEVNQREFAACFLADSQHLLNQVMEHRAHLVQAIAAKNEPSPTWLFVTVYYMALYAAMAWTRVTNAGVIYLDKEAVGEYCGNSATKPGGGSFFLRFFPGSSTSNPRVEFRKGPSHFHEAVWTKTALQSNGAKTWIQSQFLNRPASQSELLSLRSLELLAIPAFSSHVWPSKLRNSLNYRPGFSYRSVVKNNSLRLRSKLGKPSLKNLEAVVELGTRAKIAIGKETDPSRLPNEATDLLISISLLLEGYAEDALQGVCEVQGLASSAASQRNSYKRQFCAGTECMLGAI